jgi:hypothetical protein
VFVWGTLVASDCSFVSNVGAFSSHWFPILPRSRGERRSLRTFAGVSLRPPLAHNPRPRRLSTPTDTFQPPSTARAAAAPSRWSTATRSSRTARSRATSRPGTAARSR